MPPLVLRDILSDIVAWSSPAPAPTEFRFEWSDSAARHNLHILQRYDMDLDRAIRAQPFSSLSLGSEFRPVSVLAPLCQHHPLWPRVRQYLTNGTECTMAPLPETDRLEDLHAMLKRGNHASASRSMDTVIEMFKEEVRHMWQLPLPSHAASILPGAVLAPVGLADQLTINEHGEVVPKQRLTHDQSFNVVPGTRRSVNDHVDLTTLTPCRYGHALLRFIHVILSFRL
jgi:hypothetical protein